MVPRLADEALAALFRQLDQDGNGYITERELGIGLERWGLPHDSAMCHDVMAVCDRSRDGRVSYPEFVLFIGQREVELREAFSRMDFDRSGQLTSKEIRRALSELDIAASDEGVRALVERMDTDDSGEVSFEEFRQFCLLLPKSSIDQVFEYFEHISVDIGESSFTIPDDRRNFVVPPWVTLLAGSVAGAVSRTVTAPMDRLKTVMQARSTSRVWTIREGLRAIYAEGGYAAFMRGNGTNVLKIAPESGLKFFSYDYFKSQVCADPANPRMGERFAAGGLAGIVAQTLIYPLETTKTRLAVSSPGEYAGIWDCLGRTASNGGARALYRGLGASLTGIVPYAGTDLAIYTALKDNYANSHPGEEPSVLTVLCCGAVSSTCGQLVAYPLQLVRTRLQAQGIPGMRKYDGMVDCFRKTIAAGGMRALYAGLGPNFLKALPAISISYVVFEKSKVAILKNAGLRSGAER